MSDTPRTDAESFGVEIRGPGGAGTDIVYRVEADFARQLERELNAARDEIAHIKSQMCRLQDQRDAYRGGCERLKSEVEKAFREGRGYEPTGYPSWTNSRAKRIAEGLE